MTLLETRLDNTVFRLGFVNSRNQGRHFVRHNHFTVNGKKVNIPSYKVCSDVIELCEKSRTIQAIIDSLDAIVRRGIPQWLEINKDSFKGEIKRSLLEGKDFTADPRTVDRRALFKIGLSYP